MSSVTESNLGLNYGWAYGESGWNTGMDDNLVKLGFTSRPIRRKDYCRR